MSKRVLFLFVVPFVVVTVVLLTISLLFVIIGLIASAMFLVPAYIAYRTHIRQKEEDLKMSDAILKEKEELGKNVLGCIGVRRRVGSILATCMHAFGDPISIIHEVLVITPNEVLVEEIRTEIPQFGLGERDIIYHSHHKFAIPKSEIIKVELNKVLLHYPSIKLDIHEQRYIHRGINIPSYKKKYKWWVKGLIPEKKGVKLEDYENLLRPVFGDKLSVKK